jgi:hypothetical protein
VYKLIRDDYKLENSVVLNQSNCSKISFSRLDWRETVSEICVTYTDRKSQYEQSSLNDNDPTVIELAGGNKVTKSYDFPYFTIAENALWAAKRESYQQGYPLAVGSIVGDRNLYKLRTGDVAVLNWEPYGISNLLIRITDIDLGDFVEGSISIEFMEDMFSLGKTNYGFDGGSGWNEEDKFPTGAQDFRYLELPYEMIPDYDTHVFAMCAQPNVNTVKWTVWRNKEPIGWTTTTSLTKWTPAAKLLYDYAEFSDQIDMIGITVAELYGLDKLTSATLPNGYPDITAARNGSKLAVIGDEIIAWSSISLTTNGNWQLSGIIRGVHDTVPVEHYAGERIYFLETASYANVTTGGPTCRQGLTSKEYYNITTTSVDNIAEEFDETKVEMLESTRRTERPNPPGNVMMSCWKKDKSVNLASVAGDVDFSWVHRNKVTQTYGAAAQSDELIYYTGQEYTLPEGANYIFRVKVAGQLVAEHTTTENGFLYTWAQRYQDSNNLLDETIINISTIQKGLESRQSHKRTINWAIPLMIDACASEEEVQQRITEWGNTDLLAVPDGDYSDAFQSDYSQLNIFILGEKVSSSAYGTVLTHAGDHIFPNGKAVVVNSFDSYEVIDLLEYYAFKTYYMPQSSGGYAIYTYHVGGLQNG